MGLFDKKVCCVCNQKIKLLGAKKLKDGHLCKECAKGLSPFFEERKESTVEEILAQLESRKNNQELLDNYNFNKVFGEYGVILIDEVNKKIAIIDETSDGLFKSQRVVKSINDIRDKNPDIIDFSQITDVKIDVKQMTNEEYQMIDGKQVSYNPKRYKYGMDFFVKMEFNHPYIKKANIKLNNPSLMIRNEGRRKENTYAERFVADLFGVPRLEDLEVYYEANSIDELVTKMVGIFPEYSFGFKVDQFRNLPEIKKYAAYLAQAKEIERILKKP